MAILENADPKKNPVTTYLGTLFIVVSMALYGLKIFAMTKEPIETSYVVVLFIAGAALIACPDVVIMGFKGFVRRKNKAS